MYICLEGIDGSGKTTQVKRVAEILKKENSVKIITEPTNSIIGKFIRKELKNIKLSSEQLALLFAADRLSNQINSAEYDYIISDRSFLSSLVYQDDEDWIELINDKVSTIDLVIVLDLDPIYAIQRTEKEDDFENIDKLINCRKFYIKNKNYKNIRNISILKILPDDSEEKITKEILKIINCF